MVKKNKKLTLLRKRLCATNYTPPVDKTTAKAHKEPISLVFHRGCCNNNLKTLIEDLRIMMKPNTQNIQIKKSSKINDLMTFATSFQITHLLIFSMTKEAQLLKIVKTPSGPTLSFKLHEYVLAKDIKNTTKNFSCDFSCSPLIVLKGFTNNASLEVKLLGKTLQGMFCELDVNQVQSNGIRRCIFFHYDSETTHINVRHYVIKIKTNVSKEEKKINKNNLFNADMSKYDTVDDFLDSHALSGSETECEYPPIDIPRKTKILKSSIKLREIGPRMTFELIKIESEIQTGEVLFHKHRKLSLEEKRALNKARFDKKHLKMMRKKIQNENIKKKEMLKQLNKKKSLEGMEKKSERDKELIKAAIEGATQKHDDDVDWYKKEIGLKPQPDLFDHQPNKNQTIDSQFNYKQVKARRPVPRPKTKEKSKSNTKKGVKGSDKPDPKNSKTKKGPGKSVIKRSSKKKVGSKVSEGKRY